MHHGGWRNVPSSAYEACHMCNVLGSCACHIHPTHSKRILILHSGGDSQRMPICSVRGKAFTSLPSVASQHEHVMAPVDFLVDRLHDICKEAPVVRIQICAVACRRMLTACSCACASTRHVTQLSTCIQSHANTCLVLTSNDTLVACFHR